MADLTGHPIFDRFHRYSGPVPAGVQYDWIGDMYRPEWLGLSDDETTALAQPRAPAPIDQEYFEWIAVLESVVAARGEFVMLELGAGYGRWGIRGALAARQAGIPIDRIRICFVEAEPVHARWLREAISFNSVLNGMRVEVIEAAVSAADGEVPFATGHAQEWYGQQISAPGTDYSQYGLHNVNVVPVRAVSLASLLRGFDRVDLIDMDIQGAELDVMRAALDEVTAKAVRVHIETHSSAIDQELPRLMAEHGWRPVSQFPCYTSSDTEYGRIEFEGGQQYWINPANLEADPEARLLAHLRAARAQRDAAVARLAVDEAAAREALRREHAREREQAATQAAAALAAVQAALEQERERAAAGEAALREMLGQERARVAAVDLLLEQSARRAQVAEAARQAIETSTFWRATVWPRRVLGYLRDRRGA